jgi:serine/threonine-protein kinase
VLNAVRDDDKTGPTGKGSGPSPGRFLAPELLIGDPVDRRADLFSVGALLYLMLTGHPPGRDGPHPPKDLAPLLERSMAKLPESRYPRAAAMRNAIDALGLTASVTPPPVLQLVDGSTPPPLGLEGEEVPANILAPVVDESPEPGRRGARVIVGVIVAVVFLSAAAIGAVLVMRGGGQSPPASVATPGPVPEPPEPPAPEPDLELDPEPDAPVDLLAGELPAEMAELAPRVAAGEELSVQELRPLQRWAGDNRDDARPHLLIARAFLNKGWNSNAVERYLQAYQADPESRADARMLTDLVQLSTHNESGPAAATAIARIYGREALPAIEAKLAQDIGWPGDQRLERLRTRIERADD